MQEEPNKDAEAVADDQERIVTEIAPAGHTRTVRMLPKDKQYYIPDGFGGRALCIGELVMPDGSVHGHKVRLENGKVRWMHFSNDEKRRNWTTPDGVERPRVRLEPGIRRVLLEEEQYEHPPGSGCFVEQETIGAETGRILGRLVRLKSGVKLWQGFSPNRTPHPIARGPRPKVLREAYKKVGFKALKALETQIDAVLKNPDIQMRAQELAYIASIAGSHGMSKNINVSLAAPHILLAAIRCAAEVYGHNYEMLREFKDKLLQSVPDIAEEVADGALRLALEEEEVRETDIDTDICNPDDAQEMLEDSSDISEESE